MGYSFKRKARSGTRWTACYEGLDGRIRSAGTYASEDEANLAWLSRERAIGVGLHT
ncbi:MAG: hypothetical protein QOF18_1302, partial [Frankiaceae bacterium]|nr:hypothetical protein [Frankiaceae bacterium]